MKVALPLLAALALVACGAETTSTTEPTDGAPAKTAPKAATVALNITGMT